MILLDTDHLTVLTFPEHARNTALRERIAAVTDPVVGITIVSAEEAMRGWLAAINRITDVRAQITPYGQLADLFGFFARWLIIRFDSRAADEFESLRKQKVRIGTMDLKIAAIALTNNALLLSANLRDYRQVPGLRVENWLVE